jgi:hypothetical protein
MSIPYGLIGLPEFNVTLMGTLDAPILHNGTDRTIIGYHVDWIPGVGEKKMGRRVTDINQLSSIVRLGVSQSPHPRFLIIRDCLRIKERTTPID